MGAMGLSLHAGLTSMWYNGNPTLVKMLTELHDGLKDVRDYVLGLPHGLYDQTGDRRFLSRPEAAFTNAAWAALLNPKDCPAETLKGLVEHQYELGSTTSLGSGNYRPLIKYLAWRHTGDKSHLVPALEYLWKQCYYTNYLFTKTEQSGDRVHAHKALTDFMYLGGVAGARNLTYPYLAVSYEGFSPDFAGLVEEHTSETLRWVGFSFEDAPRSGRLRVWRLAPGGYEVRMGPDEDGDGRMDREDRKLTLDLKRYETIPVTLPGRTLYLVEVRQVRKDTPLYERCDLAVTHEDATRQGTGLTVVVHNLGCRATGAFAVELADANGRVLATQRHDGLDGVADLQDKTAKITFENAPAQGPLTVAVRGSVPEITEVNNRAVIPAP
jgi:hypothetical protein